MSGTPIPKGWEPYSEHTESIGSSIVYLPTPDNTHRDLLITGGFNPDEWQISGPVQTRKWMAQSKDSEPIWLYYYKFNVVAGESPEVVQDHVDELVKHIRKRNRKKVSEPFGGTDAFAYFASDWQIGKKEGDSGTPETIERVLKSFDMAAERVKELRKSGRKMPELLFAGLGDLVEGTCGFYPGQQFLIDRNRREQGRISRELITQGLDYLAPLFDRVKVAAVGGNHGGNRDLSGGRITSDGDNDDCAVFEAVKEAFDRAGDNNIDWQIMNDEFSMAVDVGGVLTGLTHGHIFTKGATPQQKALAWWKGQEFGFQPVRGSRILVSAHFHHFLATVSGMRTHLQTPANDPGSKWVTDMSGEQTPAGVLTMRLDGTHILGWDDLSILSPKA